MRRAGIQRSAVLVRSARRVRRLRHLDRGRHRALPGVHPRAQPQFFQLAPCPQRGRDGLSAHSERRDHHRSFQGGRRHPLQGDGILRQTPALDRRRERTARTSHKSALRSARAHPRHKEGGEPSFPLARGHQHQQKARAVLHRGRRGRDGAPCHGRKSAFLIQNMFPTTMEYIKEEYIKQNKKVNINDDLKNEINKKANRVLELVKAGNKHLVFPDIINIEKILLNK